MLYYDIEVNIKDNTWDGFIGVLHNNSYNIFKNIQSFVDYVDVNEITLLIGYNNAQYDNFIINYVYKTNSTFKEANDHFFRYKNEVYEDEYGNRNPNYVPRYTYILPLKHIPHCFVDMFTILHPSTFKSLKEYAFELNYQYKNTLDDYQTFEELKEYNLDDLRVTKLLFESKRSEIETLYKIRGMYESKNYISRFIHPATQIREYAKNELTLNHMFDLNKVLNTIKDCHIRDVLTNIYYDKFPQLSTADARTLYKTKKNFIDVITEQKRMIKGGIVLEFGKGGIHDKRQNYKQVSTIKNVDFSSFYPHLYLNLDIFQEEKKLRYILNERLNNKQSENAPTYKLILNTLYGTLKSLDTYSKRHYDGVTIAGQTIICELIDFLLANDPDAHIVDANTDGVMIATEKMIPTDFVSPSFGFKIPYEITDVKNLYKKDTNNYVYDGKIKGAWMSSERTLNTFNFRNIYNVIFKNETITDHAIVKYTIRDHTSKKLEALYLTDNAIDIILEVLFKYYKENGDYINGNYCTFIKKDILLFLIEQKYLTPRLEKPCKKLKQLSDIIREDFFKRFS